MRWRAPQPHPPRPPTVGRCACKKHRSFFLGGRMPSVARHFRSNCNCHCNSNSKGHCKGRSNGESNGESNSQSSSYRCCRSRGLCPLPHPSTYPNLSRSRSRSLRQCCRSIGVPGPPAKPAYLPLLRLFPCAPTLCAGASCVGWQGPPPHGCGGGAYMDVLAACPANPHTTRPTKEHAAQGPSLRLRLRLWLWTWTWTWTWLRTLPFALEFHPSHPHQREGKED